MGCVLGSMSIPSTSHDYKLSLLGPAIALFYLYLSEIKVRDNTSALWISAFTGIISLLFSITLFSLYDRPFWLQNNFPLLLIMLLLIVIIFSVLLRKKVPADMNAIGTDQI